MDRYTGPEILDRAYASLDWKTVDEEQRVIEGVASTPATDRIGDIVDSKGAVFVLPLPLLWQHDKNKPIGHVIEAKVTEAGIRIRAQIEKGILPFIDEAWALIKSRLVRGMSIGFRAIESNDIDGTWGTHFKKWEWLELSAVTIPANMDASISIIKAIDDRQLRAALGTSAAVVHVLGKPTPGASGHTAVVVKKDKSMTTKTSTERLQDYANQRAANIARMASLMETATEAGRTFDAAEQEDYDTLTAETKAIDEHTGRERTLQALQIATATPITPDAGASAAAAAAARGGNIISVKSNLPKGAPFARYCQALALSKGNLMQAQQIAKRWTDSPEVEFVLKAAVTAGTTTDADWAKPLVEYQTMAGEFIDILRPATIIGRIPGLRNVPFNIRVAGKTQGSTVGWVGEGASKPVSELKFNEVLLGWAKAAGIVVITKELARFSSPSAEALIRDDLRDAIVQFLDIQFIDPAVAAVTNVHPASITNGVTAIPSSGSSIAAINADIIALFNAFIAAGIAPTSGVFIMHPSTALSLSLQRTAQDVFAFPGINMGGGAFFGLPVVVSESVPAGLIILAIAREIFLADDGDVVIDASEQASVQMDSAPATPGTSLVSLWQQNLVGIRAERYINWQKRNPAAVQYISGYVPPAPPAP